MLHKACRRGSEVLVGFPTYANAMGAGSDPTRQPMRVKSSNCQNDSPWKRSLPMSVTNQNYPGSNTQPNKNQNSSTPLSPAVQSRISDNRDHMFFVMPDKPNQKPRSRNSNYYQVLQDVEVEDDEPLAHDEISLDQKAIRRCAQANRRIKSFEEEIRGYYDPRAPKSGGKKDKQPEWKRQRDIRRASNDVKVPTAKMVKSPMSVQAKYLRTADGLYKVTETPEKSATLVADVKSWVEAPKKVAQDIPVRKSDYDIALNILQLIPEDMKTGAMMLIDVYVCIKQLSNSVSFVDFCQKLYLSIRVMWREANFTVVQSIWGQLESLYKKVEVQGDDDEPKENLWQKVCSGIVNFCDNIDEAKNCPSMHILLDIIGVVSFFGLIGEKATTLLKQPGWEYFHKRIVDKVKTWPDVFSIVLNVFRMAADVVATYAEDGTLDFFGWKYGKRKDLFVEYSHLVAEANDAVYRRLDDADRPLKCKYRSAMSYDAALSKTIDALSVLTKKGTAQEKNTYNRMYGELIKIRGDMTEFHRSSSARVKPYTFCVCGVTSSMKSTVTQAVWRQIAAQNGISTDMTNQCTVNFKDEYFSEVKSQEILVMDDFMNGKPGVVKEGVSPIRVLLDWSSNVAVQLPGAAIDDKGKRFCNAKVLGLTCHSKNFHAETYSYQPEAAYRRVEIFIEVHLRPEFRTANGQPNFAKIPNVCFPDVWDFHLYTIVINGTDWEFERVGGTNKVFNNQELMAYLAQDSRAHFERQRALTDRINMSSWICEHNCVKDACMICNPIIPSRLPAPPSVTRDNVRLAIGAAFPRFVARQWKHIFDETWEFVRDFPEMSWVEEYYEAYATITADPEFSQAELDGLDAEYATRLGEHEAKVCVGEELVEEEPDVGEALPQVEPTLHDCVFVAPDAEILRLREQLDSLSQTELEPSWKTSLRFSLIDRIKAKLEKIRSQRQPPPSYDSLFPENGSGESTPTEITPLVSEPECDVMVVPEAEDNIELVPAPKSWFEGVEAHAIQMPDNAQIAAPIEHDGYRVDVYRVSHVRTVFVVAIEEADDDDVQEIFRSIQEWGAARSLTMQVEVEVYLDAVVFRAEHEAMALEGFYGLSVQGKEAVNEEWKKRELEVLNSGTISSVCHKRIAEWVLDCIKNKKQDWKLVACLTAYNGLGLIKVIIFNILICTACTTGFVGFLFTAFAHWKTRGLRGLAGCFFAYCYSTAMMFVKSAWKIDDYMEEWSNSLVSAPLRRKWYLAMNPHLNTSLSQKVMLRWRTPSLMDVAFGKFKEPAKFVTKIVALSAIAALVYKIWRELSYTEPVTIVPGKEAQWEEALVEHKTKIVDAYLTKVINETPPEVTEKTEEATETPPTEGLDMEVMDVPLPTLTLTIDEEAEQLKGTIKPLEGEQKDCWLKVAPPLADLTEASKTTTPEDAKRIVSRNLAYCKLTYEKDGVEKTAASHSLCIGGNDWIIPKHCIKPGVNTYHFTTEAIEGIIDNKCVGTFCDADMSDIGDTDFVLVRVRGSSLRKSVVDFFPIGEVAGCFASLLYMKDGKMQETECRRMPASGMQDVSMNGKFYRRLSVVAQSKYPIVTQLGLCTAIWMGNPTHKPFFHSFHNCGHAGTTVGGSQVITRKMILDAQKELDSQTHTISLSAEEFNAELYNNITVHATCGERHPVRFTYHTDLPPVATLLGTHEGHSGKYKQDIRPTAIAEGLTKRLGWEQSFKEVPGLNSTHHLHVALSEILHPRTTLDADCLHSATEDLRGHIMDYIHEIPNLSDSVKPLCDIVVVSGQDGVVGVDKMNPSTSAGFPERGAKGRFYQPVEKFPGVTDPFTLDRQHLDTIKKMEDILASKRRIYAPFTLSVKVEPVKMHKDYARLFGASNMCFTFMFRKYFLSIFRLIQLNPYRFGTALGINVHSEDWDQLAKILEWKDRIIEGDYKTYDKTMCPSIIMSVFTILIDIAKKAGYSERELTIMHGIAHEVCYPVYEARSLIFIAGGSNPSGHPGTFVVNSLVCCLYARYCFYREKKLRGITCKLPFAHYVREITAGDDHLFSVSPECTWFDQHVMQKNLADARIGYTDGKKNEEIPESFITLSEASFVSRGFRYCEYLGRCVAPLAIKSLKKSYMIHNLPPKPPVPPNELIATIVEQNTVELFFHGKEEYDRMNQAVRESMVEAKLGHLLPPDRSWEEIGDIIKERTIPSFQVDLRSKVRLRSEPTPDVAHVIRANPFSMEITEPS